MREIEFYTTPSGQQPIREFLDGLSSKQARKVTWVLQLVEELDYISTQYFKKLVNTDDLWEVRVNAGSDAFRFLAFFEGPRLIVVTHAFRKKTQKTPQKAIRLAEDRKRDYLRRKKI